MIFPAESYEDSKHVLYSDESGMLVEQFRGKEQGAMFYDMWCSADGRDVRFPHCVSPSENTGFQAINYMFYVKPIQSRQFIAHSATTDVSCFLVRESLNTGVNISTPKENTNPLYLEFLNKEGQLATFVFPKTYENVSFGLIGGAVKSYRSVVNVSAYRTEDSAIGLYIQQGGKHQWVTLHPALFDKR